MPEDEHFMRLALEQACLARPRGGGPDQHQPHRTRRRPPRGERPYFGGRRRNTIDLARDAFRDLDVVGGVLAGECAAPCRQRG